MGMSAFASRFREIAASETRTLTAMGQPDLPNGHYGFVELYCDEIGCDCRRVVIHVASEATGPKIWATINFGWESAEFYARWMGDAELAEEFSSATLDLLNPQSEYASILLDYFVNLVADEAYIERLKRHYTLFKSSLRSGSVTSTSTAKWKPARMAKRKLR